MLLIYNTFGNIPDRVMRRVFTADTRARSLQTFTPFAYAFAELGQE